MIHRPHRPALGWADYAIWLVFAVLATATLLARGVYVNLYSHDVFFVVDGIRRTYAGEVPHIDYHTPIGIAYVWPVMLLRLIEPFSLATMLHANLVVAFVLLVAATATLRARLAPPLFFVAALGIVATPLSPRAADTLFNHFSHLAPYNRWCEGAIMLIAAIALVRPVGARDRGAVDWRAAAVIGLLMAFLVYIKITFAAGAGGLLLLGLVFRQIAVRTVAVAAVVSLAVALVVELVWHSNAPYVADLTMAKDAISEVFGSAHMRSRLNSLVSGVSYGAMIALILLIRQGGWDGARGYLRRWWWLLAMCAAAVVGAAVMNTQVHTQREIPLLFTILLVAAEHAWRTPPLVDRRSARTIGTVLAIVAAGLVPLLDAAAVPIHAAITRGSRACTVPALRGTPMATLLFAPEAFLATPTTVAANCPDRIVMPQLTEANPEVIEIGRLTEGMALLRPRFRRGDIILALAFSNPFPTIFDAPYPPGALTWWDYGRTYSRGARPDPARLLDHTAFVLQTLPDDGMHFIGGYAWETYKADVMRRFVPVAQGRLWRLWARRRPAGQAGHAG